MSFDRVITDYHAKRVITKIRAENATIERPTKRMITKCHAEGEHVLPEGRSTVSIVRKKGEYSMASSKGDHKMSCLKGGRLKKKKISC